MATKKNNRTKIKDISAEAQELTTAEAGKVKGGAGYDLKTNKVTDGAPTTSAPTASTAPASTTAKAGYDLKANKVA